MLGIAAIRSQAFTPQGNHRRGMQESGQRQNTHLMM
jgi:hypothetical protein